MVEFNMKALMKATCPSDKMHIYITDESTRGLCVQITRSGIRTFVYRRKLAGTWRQRKIARLEDSSIAEARAKADEYNHQLARGNNIFDEAAAAKAEPTFRELFNVYVTRHAEKQCNTVVEMRKEFERWFSTLADKKASAVTRGDAEQLHRRLGEKSPYAANRAMQLARPVYNKAIAWGLYSGANPFAKISLFPEHSRDRFLSLTEAAKVFRALEVAPTLDDKARSLRDFVLLDLYTGVRKSNLYSMSWNEIDLKAGTWTIPDTKSKNKQGQVIPLGPRELDILKERQAYLRKRAGKKGISEFVFPGDGRSGHQVSVQKSWTKLRADLGLEDVHLHDLRRSLAATMASQNVSLPLIKNALNHKDMKTTANIYARTNKQAEFEARQLAHAVWHDALSKLDEEEAKVKQLPKAKRQ